MYFNSYVFILAFLPITLLGYYLINRTKKYGLGMAWLSLASIVFVGYLNPYYVPLTLAAVLIGYFFVMLVSEQKYSVKKRKTIVTLGIIVHLAILFYFKYFNFFIENMNLLLGKETEALNILLPLGISFYTFQQIAYLVDCFRDGNVRCSFGEYVLYILYFPKFLQGPILLHDDMMPYLRDEKNKVFSMEHFCRGLYAFSLGLAKKVLIADNIALMVNAGYANIEDLNSPSAIFTMIAYSVQLYFDFSGYCDMAMGVGEMLQIPLPLNFDSPYKSVKVTEIWSRWHMTLTRFFTKYVYIPLGGNRKGTGRMYANTFVVFVLSGIWHGAAWTFIVWGFMHAVAMVLSKFIAVSKIAIPKAIGWLVTFSFWVVSFAIFRAASMKEALELFSRVFRGGMGRIDGLLYETIDNCVEISLLQRADILGITEFCPEIFSIALLILPLIGCLTMKNTQQKVQEFRFTYAKLFVTVGLLFYGVISLGRVTVFLYANF